MNLCHRVGLSSVHNSQEMLLPQFLSDFKSVLVRQNIGILGLNLAMSNYNSFFVFLSRQYPSLQESAGVPCLNLVGFSKFKMAAKISAISPKLP